MLNKTVFTKFALFILLLVAVFTLQNNNAYAQTCGQSGTVGICGSRGGCDMDEKCTLLPGPNNYQCVLDNSCSCNASVCQPFCINLGLVFSHCTATGNCSCVAGTLTCGQIGTVNKCGWDGGCSNGEKCMDVGGTLICAGHPDCICGPIMCNPICAAQGGIYRGCTADGTCRCDTNTGGNTGSMPGQYPGAGRGGLAGLPDYDDVSVLLTILRNLLIPTGIIIGIVLIVTCGYSIMTSQGDPMKLKEAKECITSAIMGLIFIVLSVSILNLIIDSIIGRT